jgi:carbamoyl-phosphate synthase small subunit
MADADTRTIATTIRDKGEMLGIISTTDFKKDSLLKKLSAYKNGLKKEHIKEVSVKKPSEAKSTSAGPDIAVLDLGMLHSFTTQLKNLGCSVTLLPYHTSAEAILDMTPDGLIISGGPEDDAAIASVAKTVKALLGKVPMMGIGTGHQAIGLALGARLTRMKVGHHGVNYPVKDGANLKGDITVQNHSYTIDEASIKDRRINVTLRNINDNTVEEIESKQLKLLSVQYYPASPGFNEVNGAFKRFISMAGHRRGASAQKAARASQSEVTYAKA